MFRFYLQEAGDIRLHREKEQVGRFRLRCKVTEDQLSDTLAQLR